MSQSYQLLKTIRKTPLVLSGIVLQLLRNWFSINGDQFKYIKDDPLVTKLDIDPFYDWTPEKCQNRPGIYIGIGDYYPRGMGRGGMNDLMNQNVNVNQHIILPVCPYIVNIIGKVPGEVLKLSQEAFEVLMLFSPIIKQDFNFIDFYVEKISKIEKMEEYKEFWVSSIIIQTKSAEAWQLLEQGPKIKDVLINTYTDIFGKCEKTYQEGNYSEEKYNV